MRSSTRQKLASNAAYGKELTDEAKATLEKWSGGRFEDNTVEVKVFDWLSRYPHTMGRETSKE